MNFCPRCGHDLRSYSEQDVKEAGYPQEITGIGEPVVNTTKTLDVCTVNTGGSQQISVAKPRLSAHQLTKADRAEIRRLHAEGHSYARIRQLLRKNVTLAAIMGICK